MKYLKIFPAGLTDSLTKKSLRNLCPADVCPAEFQISCGARRHNAEPDSQYGRPKCSHHQEKVVPKSPKIVFGSEPQNWY